MSQPQRITSRLKERKKERTSHRQTERPMTHPGGPSRQASPWPYPGCCRLCRWWRRRSCRGSRRRRWSGKCVAAASGSRRSRPGRRPALAGTRRGCSSRWWGSPRSAWRSSPPASGTAVGNKSDVIFNLGIHPPKVHLSDLLWSHLHEVHLSEQLSE